MSGLVGLKAWAASRGGSVSTSDGALTVRVAGIEHAWSTSWIVGPASSKLDWLADTMRRFLERRI